MVTILFSTDFVTSEAASDERRCFDSCSWHRAIFTQIYDVHERAAGVHKLYTTIQLQRSTEAFFRTWGSLAIWVNSARALSGNEAA